MGQILCNIIRDIKSNTRSNSLHRRGTSPVVATILLLAVAVIGGSMIFVFAQEYFDESQVSGTPKIEFVKILGYDTTDAEQVKAHDGKKILPTDCCGVADSIKKTDERIAVYLQNNSVDSIFISEIRFSGDIYDFTTYTVVPPPFGIGKWDHPLTKPQPGEYVILTGHDGTVGGDLLEDPVPKIQPGQIITILIDLDKSHNISRDTQFKLTTTNGAVFVSTIVMGQNIG